MGQILQDSVLVSNYIKGDECALGVLIERHKQRIYSFIYSKVLDRDITEDIFQDTFIKVIRTLKKGNYNEEDALKPWNNYSWSKLGGECAVQMYKNSLILRITMTEKPFAYKRAYTNLKTNFLV